MHDEIIIQCGIETQCIHGNSKPAPEQKMHMVMNPVHQGSTIIYDTYEEFTKNCRKNINSIDDISPFPEYGRIGNPTIFELSQTISKLEKGDFTIITNGGMSAVVTAIMSYIKAGDHILVSDGTYTSTRKFVTEILPNFGIEFSFYDSMAGIEDVSRNIKSNTKAIFFESCASGTFEIEDVASITKIASDNNIVTICDNTLLTPVLFNPIEYGVDVVVHSLSKFVLGHADCMLGSITTNAKNFKALYDHSTLIGNHAASQSAYMALRGIKTLPLRVKDSVNRLEPIRNFLQSHDLVSEVLHPMAFSDARSNNIQKYCPNGSPSLMTVVLTQQYDEEKLAKFFNNLSYIKMGLSWGGFESLCIKYPLVYRTGAAKKYSNFTTLRLYIGMESTDDLLRDLSSSLDCLR